MATDPAVLLGSTSDGPTAIDTLGFKPYVTSVAKFLESAYSLGIVARHIASYVDPQEPLAGPRGLDNYGRYCP